VKIFPGVRGQFWGTLSRVSRKGVPRRIRWVHATWPTSLALLGIYNTWPARWVPDYTSIPGARIRHFIPYPQNRTVHSPKR